MEADKKYFVEGLFIIAFVAAIAIAFMWLTNRGARDDTLYRIRFEESVNGMSPGDPVKFRGVEVGAVKTMAIDPEDPRKVLVHVALAPDAPVRTDTRAMLKMKGITGNVYIELDGAGPQAKNLAEATPAGQIPEIPSEKSGLTNVLEQLPKVIEKFATLEDRTTKLVTDSHKVVKDVSSIAADVKEDPSLLLRGRRGKKEPTPVPLSPGSGG